MQQYEPSTWNSLPEHVHSATCTTEHRFKRHLKTHYFNIHLVSFLFHFLCLAILAHSRSGEK